MGISKTLKRICKEKSMAPDQMAGFSRHQQQCVSEAKTRYDSDTSFNTQSITIGDYYI